jgi:VCBS repeat protein
MRVAGCAAVMLVVCAGVGVAVAAAPGAPVYGSPRLVLKTDVSDRGGARIEETADFNGDGYVDVVFVRAHWPTFDTYPLQILLNNRRGLFVDGTASIFEGAPPRVQFPRELLVAEFNGDGRPDIFVADHGYDAFPGPGYQNALVLSTPSGKLRDASANLPQRSDFTHSVAAADVNGDGSVDLYVGNMYTDAQKIPPGVLLNDGTGRFTECGDCLPALMRGTITVPWHPRPLDGRTYAAAEFADVDTNGTQDLVLGGNGFYRVDNDGIISSDNQLLLNDGSGHFRLSPGALPPRGFGNTALGYDVRAADLTRDGKPDLLFAYTKTEPIGQGRWIQILVNNGDGTFRDETANRLPQTGNDAPTFIKYLRLVDLNGDGAIDIVGQLVEGAKDPPPVYLNNGQGAFTALPAGYGRTADNVFTEIDLRHTGRRDLFTTPTHTYPYAFHQAIPQTSRTLRPGTPSAPTIAPSGGGVVVSWPYEWGAVTYEVWRSRAEGGKGTRIKSTPLMRYLDRSGAPGNTYWIKAVNEAGKSAPGRPTPAR